MIFDDLVGLRMGVELYYVHDFVAVDQFDNIFSLFGFTIITPHIGSEGKAEVLINFHLPGI